MNAGLQRATIVCANALFNMSCYPTFFGSNHVYIPQYDAIAKLPNKASVEYENRFEAFVNKLGLLAKRHPEKRFIVFIPERISTSAVNPAADYMKDPETIDRVLSKSSEAIGGLPPNAAILSCSYSGLDEYYKDYFRTDHHWNMRGTIRCFNAIADALHFDCMNPDAMMDLDGYTYTGAYGRNGLMLIEETVQDTTAHFTSIIKDQSEKEYPLDHNSYTTANELKKRFSFYDAYLAMGNDGQSLVNNNGPARTAMLVSDSYGGSLGYCLAERYENIYISRQLHGDKNISRMNNAMRFEDMLQSHDADDIFFVAYMDNLQNLIGLCPNYFDNP